MTLPLLPDAERLVARFLREAPELAELAGRVYTAMPRDPVFPLVRVHRFGGRPVIDRPLVLEVAALQFDVWGGPKATVHRIAQTIRALCAERLAGVHLEGRVTGCRVGALRDLPDPDFEPPRPRFLGDLEVFTRTGDALPAPI